MKHLLPCITAATIAAAGSASAQIEIAFGGQPFGTVITNQYGLLTFSSSPGNHVTISGPPSDRYICSGPVGGPPNCTEDIYIDFEGSVSGLTFDAILANVAGPVARVKAYHSQGTRTVWFHSTGEPVQQIRDFDDLIGITRIEIFDITDDPEENGIAWDNFSFRTTALNGGSIDQAIELPWLPYTSSFDNSLVATNGPPGSCNASNAIATDNAMWFRYIPDRTGDITVVVNNVDDFQPIGTIFESRQSGLTELACAFSIQPMIMVARATAGVPVFIQVGDWGTSPKGGPFELDVYETCTGDTNGDGMLTPADFNAWVMAFNNNAPECDQNDNRECTPSDFNAWVIHFNNGC